jgi:DNA mismatch repair protein MutS
MRQYFDAKRQHQDALLLFRMGDFYELFYDDALTASRALDITLTSRSRDANGNAIPMCGVPVHAFDTYVTRLVRKGFRVAVCEQVEDPRAAKGVVRREVVRVVSPGTFTDAGYLDAREPTFLASLIGSQSADTQVWGCALVDLSTGEFMTSEYAGAGGLKELGDQLAVLSPREILLPSDLELPAPVTTALRSGVPLTRIDPSTFELARAHRALSEQLETQGVAGFGLDDHPAAARAAGALVFHLRDTQKVELAHVRSLTFRHTADHPAVF